MIDYADEFAAIVAGFYTTTADEPTYWECDVHDWAAPFAEGGWCEGCLDNEVTGRGEQAAEEIQEYLERRAIEPEVRALRNRYVREAEERGEVLTQYRKKKIREQAVREIREKHGMRHV